MAVGTVRDKCRGGGRWREDGLFIIRLRQNTAVQNGVKRVSVKKKVKRQRDKASTEKMSAAK